VTIGNEIVYLKTYSAYKTFKEAHPDDEDPVDRLGREMTRVHNTTSLETLMTVR
jgi:hypothetical protein